jgi:hypothetical protein
VPAGVPTVLQGLLTHVEANDLNFSTMRRTIIAGLPAGDVAHLPGQRYELQALHALGRCPTAGGAGEIPACAPGARRSGLHPIRGCPGS